MQKLHLLLAGKIKLHQGKGTETEAVSYLMRHTGE